VLAALAFTLTPAFNSGAGNSCHGDEPGESRRGIGAATQGETKSGAVLRKWGRLFRERRHCFPINPGRLRQSNLEAGAVQTRRPVKTTAAMIGLMPLGSGSIGIPKAQKMDGGHPTQKPVECMKRPIENNSSPGQAVYDPFVGSGTTIIAAEMTGCCHAIELHPAYVDVAVTRWQNFTGQTATLEATGEAFEAKE
jgi:DNA methylase